MNFLKIIGNGLLKCLSPFKQAGEEVCKSLGGLRCSDNGNEKTGDDLKRQIALHQAERDEEIIKLLKQIKENTRE